MQTKIVKSRLTEVKTEEEKLGKIKLIRKNSEILKYSGVTTRAKKIVIWMLIFGFLIRFAFSVLPFDILKGFVSDDSYYYFLVARTLIQSGMVFSADGITHTNGFHPLWLFTILPFWLIHNAGDMPIRMVMMWGAMLDTFAGFLLFFLLKKFFKEGISLLLTAFYLFNPVNIVQAVTGMETPLNSFVMILLLYMVVKWSQSYSGNMNEAPREKNWSIRKWSILFGIVSGLVLLARTDNVFLVAGAFIFMFSVVWRKLPKPIFPIVWSVASSGLIIAPWYLFNLIKYHTILQTSAWAYPWIYHEEFIRENGSYFSWAILGKMNELLIAQLSSIGPYFGSNFIFAFVFGGMAICALTTRGKKETKNLFKYLSWALLAVGVYLFFHIFIRWFPRIWYEQSFFIVLIPFLGLLLSLFRKKLVLILAGIFFLVSSIHAVTRVETGVGTFIPTWKTQLRADVAVKLIQQFVPKDDIVGCWNSGYVQYWSNRKVINMDGLANNEILQHYKNRTPMKYIRKRNIKWMVDNPVYFQWSFGKYFEDGAIDRHFLGFKEVKDIGIKGNDMWLAMIRSEDGRDVIGVGY